MATPAAESAGYRWADLKALLAPTPGRLGYALRLALLCTASAGVAEWFQTPEVFLTAYVGFFLLRPDRCSSVLASLAMLIAVSVLIGGVVLLSNAIAGRPAALLTAMSLVAFVLLFLTSSSKLQPVGGTLALIVTFALSLIGRAPEGELITRGLLYGWLMVAIPAGVSVLLNLLAGPAPRRLAERALARRLGAAAALLHGGDEASRKRLQAYRDEGTAEIEEWLELAALEHTSPAQDLRALQIAIGSTTQILRLVEALDRLPAAAAGSGLDPAAVAAQREQLAATLRQMAAILHQGGYPVQVEVVALSAAPPSGMAVNVEADPVAAALAALRDALRRFAEGDAPADAAPATAEPNARGGFFAADAWTNPEHVRFALKGTAAAMLCYLLYTGLDWEGIHTAFITAFIVAQSTTAETVQKLALRITGCLIGAALALISLLWLLPAMQGLGQLLVLLFAVTLPAAWLAVGSPRIAYVGFQIAFAFYLCVLQGNGPAFDLGLASDRIIGILIGNGVVYLVFTRFWPVSVAKRVDPALAALLRRLGRIAEAPQSRAAHRQSGQAESERAHIAADLSLLAFEPASIRPGETWIGQRRHTLQCAAALEVPLALAPEAVAAAHTLQGLAARLQQPAGAGTDGAAPTPPVPLPDWLAGPLQALVDAVQAQQAGRPTPHAAH